MNHFRMIIIVLILASCQNKKDESFHLKPESKKETITNTESFDQFNARFHSDSVFQLSRVDFPIEGISVSGFEKHNWTKQNWQFLSVPVAEKTEIGDYEHSLMKTDTLVIEKFWIPGSSFEVERQFKLINNTWFLVYYNDINL